MTAAPMEARLGRLAAAALASSMLLVGAFFAFAFTSVLGVWLPALLAAALLAIFLVQIYCLSTVGRHSAQRRLRIWQLSLAVHGLVFVAGYLLVRNSVIFALLIPEALSALIHLFGIRYASGAQDAA